MSMPEERRRVVMVDDDEDYRSMLREWLVERYDTTALPNGEDLIEQLFLVLPDLVLLDISLPGPDGFTLCERIRSEPRFQELPVLFLTSSDSNSDFVSNLSAGGSAYLTKPVERSQLLKRIAELLPAA
jgi:CheY-like chemotaxis protein